MSCLVPLAIVGWIAAAVLATSGAAWADFSPLFNGVNLDGWHQVGGDATYHADDGEIVGLSAPNSPNTFLVTDLEYADFVLEADFRIFDTSFNSGIQIRSHSLPTHNNGQLFGYQVEIDPSSRAWSGGIYFEGGSPDRPAGWLDDLSDNPVAQSAFVLGEWNHFRIVALGRRITTWINDVLAADYVDDDGQAFLPTGVIGLQVHSNSSQTPLEVRWRNLLIDQYVPGDFDRDGALSLEDYLVLSANLHTDVSDQGPVDAYLHGDMNGDRQVNFYDLVAFRAAYPSSTTESAIQSAPEPSTGVLIMMLGGVIAISARRRLRSR